MVGWGSPLAQGTAGTGDRIPRRPSIPADAARRVPAAADDRAGATTSTGRGRWRSRSPGDHRTRGGAAPTPRTARTATAPTARGPNSARTSSRSRSCSRPAELSRGRQRRGEAGCRGSRRFSTPSAEADILAWLRTTALPARDRAGEVSETGRGSAHGRSVPRTRNRSRASRAAPRMPASSPRAAGSIRILPSGSASACARAEVAHQVEPGLAQRLGHAAADDDDLGAEDVDQAAEAEAEVVRRAADLPGGDVVARGDGLGQVAALEPAGLCGPSSRASTVGMPLRIALVIRRVMAVRLARASMHPRAPQPHCGPPAFTMMWPTSPGVAGRPVDDLPVLDEAAADPGADEGGDDVAIAPPRPEPELAVAADPDVVLDEDRPIQDRREHRARARSCGRSCSR